MHGSNLNEAEFHILLKVTFYPIYVQVRSQRKPAYVKAIGLEGEAG
jgi:hypothetical protein